MATEAKRLARIRKLLQARGVADDVVAAVEAEVRAASEERADIDRQFRALATVGWDGIAVSVNGEFIEVDDGWTAMFGYPRHEIVGRFAAEIVSPESLPAVMERIRTGDERPYVVQGVRKDGTVFPLEVVGRNVQIGGRSARVTGFRDRSEQAATRQDLADLQERFRSFADLVPVALAEADERGRIAFLNRAALQLQGITSVEQALGVPVFEWVHPDDRPRAVQNFTRRLNPEHMTPVEYRLLRHDGREFPGMILARPFILGGIARGIHAVVIDLSEQKAAEEARAKLDAQIQHAQKLDSLGALAGGIAHDFNNLFGAILGNVDLAVGLLRPDDAARRPIEAIGRAGRRAADLTAQMMAYAGAGPVQTRPVDLAQIVEEMTDLLGAGLSKRARLSIDFAAGLPTVRGDASRLQQVVLNLLTNASEALSGSPGHIAVTAWSEDLAEPTTVAGEPLAAGTWVVFEVADDGEGMTVETLARIFEPFFSTRFAGRGLGLAAVLGIVRSHGGAIEVETLPGDGSTFRVWLPAASEAETPTAPTADLDWRGAGTVLVVDDDPDVLEVVVGMLEHLGFDVVSATDGIEAMRVLRQRGATLAAVVLDVTMPPPGGTEVYESLRARGLAMPVIVTSGYLEAEAMSRFGPPRPEAFLHKPFRLGALSDVLRAVIP